MTTRERIAWITGAAGVMAALALGYWWGAAHKTPAPVATSVQTQRRVLYWYDPMVPEQHFDKPGKSPFMDMELLPKYADDAAGSPSACISPLVGQNLGIRTVAVVRGHLPNDLRVPGVVTWNLSEERVISLPVDAVVERLFVRTPFEPVRAGQTLMSVRAPAWSAAFAEAQALRMSASAEGRSLQSAANGRLRALGLPAGAYVDQRGGIAITAPVSGVASEIVVREGQSVTSGTPLLRLNGTRPGWIEASPPPPPRNLRPGHTRRTRSVVGRQLDAGTGGRDRGRARRSLRLSQRAATRVQHMAARLAFVDRRYRRHVDGIGRGLRR